MIRILMCLSLLPLLAACNGEDSKIFISSMRAKAGFENIPDLPASATVDINFSLSGTSGNQIEKIEAYYELSGSARVKIGSDLSADQRSFTWNIPEAKTLGISESKAQKQAKMILKVIGRTATTENISNSFNVVNMGTMSVSSKVFFKNTNTFEIGTCSYELAVVEPFCNTMTSGTKGSNCSINCNSGKLMLSNLPAPQPNTVQNISTFIGIKLKGTEIKFQFTPVIYLDAQAPTVTSFTFLEPFTDQDITIVEGSTDRKLISTTKLQTLNFTVQDNPAVTDNNVSTSVLIDKQASNAFSELTHCTGTNSKTCRISNLFISQTKGEHKITIKSTDQSGNIKQSDFVFYYEPTAKPVITTLTASKNQNIAAIESGDNLSGLSDYSTDVASYQNGAGEYYVRFKAVDQDDHSTDLMKTKSGLKSITVSAVDKNGLEKNTINLLDSTGNNTSSCKRATLQTGGIGQYFCAKITASADTKYIKVNATDRSSNTVTRVFKINLGTGTRVMAGAGSGPLNFSGNQSADFSKGVGALRSDRGMKVDSKNIIYFLRFEGGWYQSGGLYTVHPRDGLVRKIANFSVYLPETQLNNSQSSKYSFENPYQTSQITSFDLDSKDDSILYLYELRRSSGKYKALVRKFKLTYTITNNDNVETASLTMKEETFAGTSSSTLEPNSTDDVTNVFKDPFLPNRLQVYSIEKGLFFTSSHETNRSILYMNSFTENKQNPAQKIVTKPFENEASKVVDVAAPVMVGNDLYYLVQNSKQVSGGWYNHIDIIQSNLSPNSATLSTGFTQNDHQYSWAFALNKRGDLSRTLLSTQGNMSQFYQDNTGVWKLKMIFKTTTVTANGFSKDGIYTDNDFKVTLYDVLPMEDNSYLMIDGNLLRSLETFNNNGTTNFKLTTLMGESAGIIPKINGYPVNHPLSLKLGLLSNIKPFRNSNDSAKPIVKLSTYDHTAGKIFEFNSTLTSVSHVAGNSEQGSPNLNVDATLSPTIINSAGQRSSTIGYNLLGNILYGSLPIYELKNSKFTESSFTTTMLNPNRVPKKSKNLCMDQAGDEYTSPFYVYSLLSDTSEFQAIGSNYFDFVCNNHRSSQISILDGNTNLKVGNQNVDADGRNSATDTKSRVPSCFENDAPINNCSVHTLRHIADAMVGQVSKVDNDYWITSSVSKALIKVNPSSSTTSVVFTAPSPINGFVPFKEGNTQSIYACVGSKLNKWSGLGTGVTPTKVASNIVPEIPCRMGNLLRRSETSNSILFMMPQDDSGTSVVEFTQ